MEKQYKITLNQFLNEKDNGLIAIWCEDLEQAQQLWKAFDNAKYEYKDGMWSDNYDLVNNAKVWKGRLCYTNTGRETSLYRLETLKEPKWRIFKFDEVDLENITTTKKEAPWYVPKEHEFKVSLWKFLDPKKNGAMAIQCSTRKQAQVLWKLFELNSYFSEGESWFTRNYYFDGICYTNNGYGGKKDNLRWHGYKVYDFDEVDLFDWKLPKKSQEWLKNNPTKQEQILFEPYYNMTVDEFWEDAKNNFMAIHCPHYWQAKILSRIFTRMGKRNENGELYYQKDAKFSPINWYNEKETAYDNCGGIHSVDWYRKKRTKTVVEHGSGWRTNKHLGYGVVKSIVDEYEIRREVPADDWRKCYIYNFYDIDYTKYLTPAEAQVIQEEYLYDPFEFKKQEIENEIVK
ncbi:MAG: hypothetical protein J6A28_00875 [Clostridia bacterium]|nr:hypothetical protein [Clostridia bacterium]